MFSYWARGDVVLVQIDDVPQSVSTNFLKYVCAHTFKEIKKRTIAASSNSTFL